jgi:hypothetical protein
MRQILFGVILMASGLTLQAQDDIQEMLQQIIVLDDYVGSSEKGYLLAERDIDTISDITGDEFELHQAFFNSLGTVDPAVANTPGIADINNMNRMILRQLSTSLNQYLTSQWLSVNEMTYVEQAYSAVSIRCDDDIGFLRLLLTDYDLTMTDGDRIRLIGTIDKDIRDEYEFVQAFQANVGLAIAYRQKDAGNNATLKTIYGIQ